MRLTTSSLFVRLAAFALALAAPIAAQGWVQRAPSGSPPARNNAGAAYDVHRGVTVLFGGQGPNASLLSDTVEWNGTTWAPRATPVKPSGRWGHGMAFDSKRGRVVLFGGYDGTLMRDDTWEWDGVAWTQRVVAARPPARGFGSFAYDGARGVCVLFGGQSASQTLLADTWEWDGSAWTQRATASAPSPRQRAAMAYDDVRRQTLLFGGGDGTQVLGDTWWWSGVAWTQVPTPTAPPARWDAAFAFDGNCGRAVLFGGGDATWATNFGDSWAWNGTAWSQLTGSSPSPRHSPAIAHDAQRGQFVVFGGRDASSFAADTWELAPSCSRTMTMVAPAVVGQTAQFRYDYPGTAGNLHFCWTLVTPRQAAAFAVPIPGFPSIGLCRVDLFNVLLDPAQFLDGSGALVTAVPIPNNPAFSGFQFDVQSVDLDFFTLALRWAATDVEVTVGQAGPQPNPALNMVAIAPGTFAMGSTAGLADEQPVHPVSLTQPFWMGKFEVTQAQYQSVMGNNPSYFQGTNAPNALQRPVDSVSWNSAVAFCQALTAIEQAAGRVPTGYQYRLPTEAEWEYCCRAGTTTEWSTGVSLTTSEANFGGALASASYPFGQTSVVGSYAPNGFGLHDMHGNVLEWCLDAYAAYAPGPASDPLANVGLDRVYRGGGWETDFSVFMCRSSFRYNTTGATPGFSNEYFGFRIVLAPIRFAAPNPLLNMVPIAPGTFQMGSTAGQSNEQPVHQVTLTQPFWMGKYEVTQAQYQAVMGSNPSYFQGVNAPNASQRPVEQVSWSGAVAYCQALTVTEQAAGRVPPGYQYRLPTEAEWEYCCRAGTTTEWNTGTNLSASQANFAGALANSTHPGGQTAVVGSYAPNAFGLHDMHGNVWEWCLDSYATYAPGTVIDPFVTGGANLALRGGSFYINNSATSCRSAFRNYSTPGITNYFGYGLRLVLAPVLVP